MLLSFSISVEAQPFVSRISVRVRATKWLANVKYFMCSPRLSSCLPNLCKSSGDKSRVFCNTQCAKLLIIQCSPSFHLHPIASTLAFGVISKKITSK